MKTKYHLIFLLGILLASCGSSSTTEEEELFSGVQSVAEDITLFASEEEIELFGLINQYRATKDLEPLAFSSVAHDEAGKHNGYMIVRDELSHDNFNARATKVSSKTGAINVAENVARNFKDLAAALQGWLDSDPHRETIEGDFTHAGLAITVDGLGNPYYTHIFFKR